MLLEIVMVYVIFLIYIVVVFFGSLCGVCEDVGMFEGYFLVNCSLGILILFFIILVINFSVFYFLGFAGEGYCIGYVYYVIMVLGMGFVFFLFFLLGIKIWWLGKEKGYIMLGEFIYD